MLDDFSPTTADLGSSSISLVITENAEQTIENVQLAPASTHDLTPYPSEYEFQLSILNGATEQIFLSQVFVYLSATDLCILATVSRFFSRASLTPHLWADLLKRDFVVDEVESGSSVVVSQVSPRLQSMSNGSAKSKYMQRFEDVNRRARQKNVARQTFEANLMTERRIGHFERFLDVVQVRLLIPLPIVSLFLSLILLTLRFDGLDISIWACAAPLLFFFVYLAFCIVIARIVFNRQYTAGMLNGMWQNMRGPVKLVFTELLGENSILAYFTVGILILVALEILLVAVKLSTNTTPKYILESLPWGVVFLPIWCLFSLYCVAPSIRCITDKGGFLLGIVLVWIPFFILCVCLTVKLNGEEHHSALGRIRLALIFMPFWIIEGTVMIGSLIFMLIGIQRMRRGFLDRIDEHVGLFISCWLLMAPFLIFQAMVSARDDEYWHRNNKLTSTDTVISLLISLGWLLLCSITFIVRYRTPFQEIGEYRRYSSAGTTVLYRV